MPKYQCFWALMISSAYLSSWLVVCCMFKSEAAEQKTLFFLCWLLAVDQTKLEWAGRKPPERMGGQVEKERGWLAGNLQQEQRLGAGWENWWRGRQGAFRGDGKKGASGARRVCAEGFWSEGRLGKRNPSQQGQVCLKALLFLFSLTQHHRAFSVIKDVCG